MKPASVNPSSCSPWPSWKIRITIPTVAPVASRFMTTALIGSTTLRNTTVRNSSDSAEDQPQHERDLRASFRLTGRPIFAGRPADRTVGSAARRAIGGTSVARMCRTSAFGRRRSRSASAARRSAALRRRTARHGHRGDAVVSGRGSARARAVAARACIGAAERAGCRRGSADDDLDRRQRARAERARQHLLALARRGARQRARCRGRRRCAAPAAGVGREDQHRRDHARRAAPGGASPPAPTCPHAVPSRPAASRRAAASAPAARPVDARPEQREQRRQQGQRGDQRAAPRPALRRARTRGKIGALITTSVEQRERDDHAREQDRAAGAGDRRAHSFLDLLARGRGRRCRRASAGRAPRGSG